MYACIYCDPDFSCGCAIQSEVVQEVLADLKRTNQYILAAHSELLCFLLFPKLISRPTSLFSEIQLAMKSSHSSLILWPISQCWWWCIINISDQSSPVWYFNWLNEPSTERQKNKEVLEEQAFNRLLHFPSLHPRLLFPLLNLSPTWKPREMC